MGNADRLKTCLKALVADASTRPGPPRNLTDAALRNDVAAIDAFLDGGAELDERSIGFVSPLAAAAGRGHLEAVRRLIERGASLDPPGALFPVATFAVMNRRLEVLEYLLRAGIAIAPLAHVFKEMAKGGAWDVVDLLLAHGADPDWLDTRQRRALAKFVAARAPRSAEYRAQLAAAQRAQDAKLLAEAQKGRLDDAARARIEAEALALVAAEPALAQAVSDHGTPVLALAAEAAASELVNALLRAGAAANPAMAGPSPLVRAIRRCDLRSVRALLAAGADPDAQNAGTAHPLVEAARAGSLDCVQALVDAGARALAPVRKAVGERANGVHRSRIVALVSALAPARRPRPRAD